MSKYHYRLATASDSEALAETWFRCQKENYSDYLPDDYDVSQVSSGMDDMIAGNGEKLWLVLALTESEEIVGYACTDYLHHFKIPWNEPFHAWMRALYVMEAHQGHAVGKGLWQETVSMLASAGVTKLGLRVLATAPAREFYRHMGGHLLRSESKNYFETPSQTEVYEFQIA
ncbi:MAG: GNAT family N-acetyltransferase [Gammaproteobacteria bacterium]|nr:GNAT family N-acetyltransferase [Gammaproteobacteria bacterium]